MRIIKKLVKIIYKEPVDITSVVLTILIPTAILITICVHHIISLGKIYEECKELEKQIVTQQENVSNIELFLTEDSNSFEREVYICELKKLNNYIEKYNKKASKYNSKNTNTNTDLQIYKHKSPCEAY